MIDILQPQSSFKVTYVVIFRKGPKAFVNVLNLCNIKQCFYTLTAFYSKNLFLK